MNTCRRRLRGAYRCGVHCTIHVGTADLHHCWQKNNTQSGNECDTLEPCGVQLHDTSQVYTMGTDSLVNSERLTSSCIRKCFMSNTLYFWSGPLTDADEDL